MDHPRVTPAQTDVNKLSSYIGKRRKARRACDGTAIALQRRRNVRGADVPFRLRDPAILAVRHEPTRTPEERPSGVRPTVERAHVGDDDASDAPTLPPPPSLRDLRDTSAPLEELLYRFEVGDHKGALSAAETLLDQRLVPTIVVPRDLLSAIGLEPTAVLLLTFIDGRASLETVLETSGVPMIEALRALCDLLEQRVVVLR